MDNRELQKPKKTQRLNTVVFHISIYRLSMQTTPSSSYFLQLREWCHQPF